MRKREKNMSMSKNKIKKVNSPVLYIALGISRFQD
jgi:hypothetical protein